MFIFFLKIFTYIYLDDEFKDDLWQMEDQFNQFTDYFEPIFVDEEILSEKKSKLDLKPVENAVSSIKEFSNEKIETVKKGIKKEVQKGKSKENFNSKIVKKADQKEKAPPFKQRNRKIKEELSSEEEEKIEKKEKKKRKFLPEIDKKKLKKFLIFLTVFSVSTVFCISIFFYFYNGYRKARDEIHMADHYRTLTRPRIEPDNDDEQIRRTVRFG